MTPTLIARRIDHAQAAAAGLRDTAACCRADQQALRDQLLVGAQVLDDLVELAQLATFVAKLNHETILARAEPPEKTWDCCICGRSNYVTVTHCEHCDYSRMVTRQGVLVLREGR